MCAFLEYHVEKLQNEKLTLEQQLDEQRENFKTALKEIYFVISTDHEANMNQAKQILTTAALNLTKAKVS